MLSVIPIQSKSEQETVCLLCSAKYNADLLAYKVLDDERVVGVCQFRMTPEGGSIVTLNGIPGTDCFDYLFLLGRGTLNFMDNCGASYAYLDDNTVDKLLTAAIGFTPDENGRPRIDLKRFFQSPCGNM